MNDSHEMRRIYSFDPFDHLGRAVIEPVGAKTWAQILADQTQRVVALRDHTPDVDPYCSVGVCMAPVVDLYASLT